MLAAGCIIVVDFSIYGHGKNVGEAMRLFEENLELQEIKLIDADTDLSVLEFGPQYIRREDIRVLPATAALLDAVHDGGGNIQWAQQGAIACLPKEISWWRPPFLEQGLPESDSIIEEPGT